MRLEVAAKFAKRVQPESVRQQEDSSNYLGLLLL